MSDHRATYAIAARQIAEYVQPLWPGALAMPFDVKDEEGRSLSLADDHLSGQSLILVFLNYGCDAEPVLSAFASQHAFLAQHRTTVVAFNATSDARANGELKQRTGFRWPLPADSTGAIFASYGVHKGGETAVRIVLLTPFRQIRAWFDDPDNINEAVEDIMSHLKSVETASEAHWSPPHAPVLLVPNVLTAEECAALIESFETGGPFTVRKPRPGEFEGDYKIPVYDHNRQDRVDHIIKNKDTLALLDERIFGRVVPIVKKAFAYDITRREDLHIARYVGARSGNVMGHRDNVSAATSYRRFAFSMNLNTDYEGGEIVFREFSSKGYRAPAGTALVFSSALLHEVLETTRGVRYNLISHFFNEQSLPPPAR